MPINQDGEEVNPDGTPITEEQQETHDFTEVIELHNKTKVKPYSIEELATSSVPHNIPYLEVYRTDELFYEEYKSPFLSDISVGDGSSDGGDGSSDGGDGSGDSGGTVLWTELANIVNAHITVSSGMKNQYIQRLRDADTNWTAIAKIVNGHKIFGNATQDTVIRAIMNAKKNASSSSSSGSGGSSGSSGYAPSYSSKNKNKLLSNSIEIVVRNNFKKTANVKTLVKRYLNCKTNRESIGSVTNRSSVHLKASVKPSTVNDAIYKLKHKYT